jgi:AAA15 family ATPase/GTPase
MLIEFRVKNFRSLRDEQVFSMVATTDKKLLDTHATATGLKAAPHVLHTVAIYGANASGKSNLIKAMQFMRWVVVMPLLPGQSHDRLQSFRLDRDTMDEPTEFETTFLVNGVRYQYGFVMTQKRIIEEYLYVYKTSKPQMWFERTYNADKELYYYEYGPSMRGNKASWEQQTRDNNLYLTVSSQYNSELLTPVFSWFLKILNVVNELEPISTLFTIQNIENVENIDRTLRFIKSADFDVDNIEVEKQKVPRHEIQLDLATGVSRQQIQEVDQSKISFWHRTAKGEAKFDLFDESTGTQRFFWLSGPLFDVLENGKIIIFDEIEAHLHPNLVSKIIDLFQNSEVNKHGAQLIFATHSATLLGVSGLFRRDQIWLVNKNKDQASLLEPLSDFSPRKGESVGRGYLQGRYGGLPFIDELKVPNYVEAGSKSENAEAVEGEP